MIRNILLSSAAIAALTTGALAADLPGRRAPVVVAPPVFTWTGFYIGLNAGGAFERNNNGNDITPTGAFITAGVAAAFAFPLNASVGNSSNGGFTGGGTIGYNLQFGQFVLGFEGDANYLENPRRSNNAIINPLAGGGTETFTNGSNDSQFLATARARFGIAYDRALFYVTGGGAYRSGGNNDVVTFANAAGVTTNVYSSQNSNNNNFGYVGGAGVEYAFTDNLSGKLEGLYAGFNRNNTTLFSASPVFAGRTFTERHDRDLTIVRVGLNYKFGFGGYAPAVVAKY